MVKYQKMRDEVVVPVEESDGTYTDPETGQVYQTDELIMAILNSAGAEILNSQPVESAIGKVAEMTIEDRVRMLITNDQLQRELAQAGEETFDEADDFGDESEDGDEFGSPHEERWEPTVEELQAVAKQMNLNLVNSDGSPAFHHRETASGADPRKKADPPAEGPEKKGKSADKQKVPLKEDFPGEAG